MNLSDQNLGDESSCDQAWHQMMLEREQLGEECAKRLAQHVGTWQDIDYLCHMAGIKSPFEGKEAA